MFVVIDLGNTRLTALLRTMWKPGDFADSPDSLALFAVPKRIGLKSHIRLSGVLVNSPSITSSDVSTYLRHG
jgi:hypothetical protein